MNREIAQMVGRSAGRSLRNMAWLGLASVLACTGCSTIKVKLGMRVALVKTPVTAIEASLPNNPGIAPGEKSPLVVAVTGQAGKVLLTEGKAKGKVLWKDLTVTTSVVTADKKGNLTLARDPRVSDGKMGHVTITVPSHPGIQADLDIPLRYDYPFVANYSGSGGSSGMNGSDGQDGTSGSMGSIDPNNPSAGGDGTNGTNGTDGSAGGNGGDGPSIEIHAALRSPAQPDGHPMLMVGITAPGHKEHFYLVDTHGGSLTVNDDGGPGGSGGKGGRGGRGGSGGVGTPNGSNGLDGSSGQDGASGSDGYGGSITMIYDPEVAPYLALIRLKNPGGPQPVLQQQPVPPLW